MQPQDTLNKLDRLIQSRSILDHPFYVAWRNGELTPEQLATYARVYYPHVAEFPNFLRIALESAEDEAVRAELETNLDDELNHPKAHSELWLDFAAGVGAAREDLPNEPQHPAALNIVGTFEHLSSNGTGGALAALYAYESQQPEVARQKSDGLQELYGVDNPDTLAYFEVHAETDIEHRQGERWHWSAAWKTAPQPRKYCPPLHRHWIHTGDCWTGSARRRAFQQTKHLRSLR